MQIREQDNIGKYHLLTPELFYGNEFEEENTIQTYKGSCACGPLITAMEYFHEAHCSKHFFETKWCNTHQQWERISYCAIVLTQLGKSAHIYKGFEPPNELHNI